MAKEPDWRPFVFAGVLLAVLMIFLATREISPNTQAALEAQFRPTTPGPATLPLPALPELRLPALPGDLQQAAADIQRRLAAGQRSPALTPAAENARARVEIAGIERAGERIIVYGTLTARAPLTLPANAFVFRDSSGASYTADAGAGAALTPGTAVPFELGVALPAGRGLALTLVLPPDEPLTLPLLAADG